MLAIGALLPLGAFSGVMTFETLRSYQAADEARLRETARALAAAVDAQFAAMMLTATAISESSYLDPPADIAAFERSAARQAAHFEGWIAVLSGPPEHRLLAVSAPRVNREVPAALSADVVASLAEPMADVFGRGLPAVSDLFTVAELPHAIIAVIVPVDREHAPRQALGLAFGPELMRRILARQDLPGGTFAAIADGRLRIVAHTMDPNGERAGAEAPDWVRGAIAGRQRGIIIGPGWSGRDNIYAMERPMTAPGWTVVVARPASEQAQAAWRVIGWLALGFLAFGLGLAALAWAGRREALKDVQRQAEALRRGREQVERLHGGLPAVLFLREVAADGTSRLLYRGGAIEAVTGWPPEAFPREDGMAEQTHPEDPRVEALLRESLRSGSAEQEWRLRQPDGSWRWMRTHCRRLALRPDGGGDIVGYILNVTAEREARGRALTSARLASLGEMAAGLAHELKQPLQAISLAAENAQFASASLGAPELNRRLERIIGQAQRAGDIIEHLRRFARGADDRAAPSAVGLDQVAEGVLAMIGHSLRDQEIEIGIDLGTPPLRVLGDRIGLEQVLTNLLLNARDAIIQQPFDARRAIAITATAGPPGRVTLRIADTGGGIPAQVMPRIFEPFVTTKELEKGTGLGLAVCHGLLASMGGSIAVENGTEGAVFTLTLPAAPEEGGGADQTAPGNPVKA
ncbi:PAS domain-containing protein [Roseomonas eburnea]|uniref:histidine kinase n=1 Tax=Neoroseomonas eburnea TaxID=1346889 RepID=A0A9X9XD50_9PROT|nr:ATP-binding protein [Neoroseomonas eburnea]MBR0681636.1 PAS domain-containing protein [Neoroseomonas eburnea]